MRLRADDLEEVIWGSQMRMSTLSKAIDILRQDPRRVGDPRVRAFLKRHRHWLRQKSLQGLAIGRRITKGKECRDLAIHVYLQAKRAKRRVARKRCVPRRIRVPGLKEPIRLDVIAIGRIVPHAIAGGAGIAVDGAGMGAGTLGCIVRRADNNDPAVYLLSCAHVIGNNAIQDATSLRLRLADCDPPTGGQPRGPAIATFFRSVGFVFSNLGWVNPAEAAIAKIDSGEDVDSFIRDLARPTGFNRIYGEKLKLKKSGCRTRVTRGEITSISGTTEIYLDDGSGRRKRVGLCNQIYASRMSDEGDSGSVVLDEKDRIVGIIVAGSSARSVITPIGPVIDELGIRLP